MTESRENLPLCLSCLLSAIFSVVLFCFCFVCFWPCDISSRSSGSQTPARLELADRGMSCASFCRSKGDGWDCDAAAMRAAPVSSKPGLIEMLEPSTSAAGALLSAGVVSSVTCNPPILQSCSAIAPAFDAAQGRCWYHKIDGNCSLITGGGDDTDAAEDLSGVRGCEGVDTQSDRATCEVTPSSASTLQRFCICQQARRSRRVAVEVQPATAVLPAESESRPVRSIGGEGGSSSSDAPKGAVPSRLTIGVLTLIATGALSGSDGFTKRPAVAFRAGSMLASMALVLSAIAPTTDAHNWMHTPSRSFKKASTTTPCLPRKASDTHQQVGPGQTFAFKWATGHAGDSGSKCMLHSHDAEGIAVIRDTSDPRCIPIGKEYTSVSIIKAENYDRLKGEFFQEMLEDYVVHAPSSDHMDPHWARYHGLPDSNCGNCDGLGEDRGGVDGFVYFANMSDPPASPKGSSFHIPGRDAFTRHTATELYAGRGDTLVYMGEAATDGLTDPITRPGRTGPRSLVQIGNTSMDFLNHTFAETGHIYRYSNAGMRNDRRVSYRSVKYPWLLFAGVYPHIFQRPSDYDAIRVQIPLGLSADGQCDPTNGGGCTPLEPGHYIVHYRWKGYSDCSDVEVHDVQMDHVDGVDQNAYIWNKVDHCQYEAPEEVRSSCHVSSGSPDRCVAEIQQGQGRSVRARYGVNVVPISNPATVFPALADQVNIPWKNASCANTPLTTITGAVKTVSEQLDWDTWFSSAVVRRDNQRCDTDDRRRRLFDAEMTLRDAVAKCTSRQCAGLSVVPSVASGPSDYIPGPDALDALIDYDRDCHAHSGNLDEAKRLCDQWAGCTAVYDYRGDNSTWKACSSLPYLSPGHNYTERQIGPTLIRVPRTGSRATAANFESFIRTGTHRFVGCMPEGTAEFPMVDEASCRGGDGTLCWVALTKAGTAEVTSPIDSSAQRSIGFMFASATVQRMSTSITPPADGAEWHTETGELFQPRGGQEYGFKCVLDNNDRRRFRVTGEYGRSALAHRTNITTGCPGNLNQECIIDGEVRWDPNNPPVYEVPWNHTYLSDIQNLECPDVTRNEWNVAVPNGAYEVQVVFGKGSDAGNIRVGACAVENTRTSGSPGLAIYQGWARAQRIEISDGTFTLKGVKSPRALGTCYGIQAVRLTKIGESLSLPWLPVQFRPEGAWWQMALPTNDNSVGSVAIAPADSGSAGAQYTPIPRTRFDCRLEWLFTRARCTEHAQINQMDYIAGFTAVDPAASLSSVQAFAPYDDAGITNGIVVSISDTPCSGGTCSSVGQHMCRSAFSSTAEASIAMPGFFPKGERVAGGTTTNLYPSAVDCGGHRGAYLRVWLPGPERVFDADVFVNRAAPRLPQVPAEHCAVKVANPAAGPNPECVGLSNHGVDGTCCETTMPGSADAGLRNVQCCADRNPFIQKCETGELSNVASGTYSIFTVQRNQSGDSGFAEMISVNSRTGKPNSRWKWFQGDQDLGEPSADTGDRDAIWCWPKCSVLIDLGLEYQIDQIDVLGYRPLRQYTISAWQPNGAVGSADENRTEIIFDTSDSWVSIVSKADDAAVNVNDTWPGLAIAARYLKLRVTGNTQSDNRRQLSLNEISILGCDAIASPVVPELRGAVVDDAIMWHSASTRTNRMALSRTGGSTQYGFRRMLGPTSDSGLRFNQTRWADECPYWGGTALFKVGSPDGVTFTEAEQMCEDVGARMCTAEEVNSCGPANAWFMTRPLQRPVWTSSSCGTEPSGMCPSENARTPVTHTVSWGHAGGSAASIIIMAGDTVTWLLDQEGGHNVVSGRTWGVADGLFVSPWLANLNDSWSYTFSADGSFPYYCGPHQNMVARITVLAVPATVPGVGADAMTVCYGVEAQKHHDESTPEVRVSLDPADPVFYSTCYIRERAVLFEPSHGQSSSTAGNSVDGDSNQTNADYQASLGDSSDLPPWTFNGECLECESYDENRMGGQAPPVWAIRNDGICRDCINVDGLTPSIGRCSIETVATTGPPLHGTCYVASDDECDAELSDVTTVATVADCAAALRVAYPTLVPAGTYPVVHSVDTGDRPSGCSAEIIFPATLQGYFNSDPAGYGACSTRTGPATYSGKVVSSGLGTELLISMVPSTGRVDITLRGPTDGWFGFGFDAHRMSDHPYTLIVEPQSQHKVSEWVLGAHNRGRSLTSVDSYVVNPMLLNGHRFMQQSCNASCSSCGWGNPASTPLGARAGAECCDDDAPVPGMCSRQNCSRSTDVNTDSMTFEEANTTCADRGLRLCTRAESHQDAATTCCRSRDADGTNSCSRQNFRKTWTSNVRDVTPALPDIVRGYGVREGVFELNLSMRMDSVNDRHTFLDPSIVAQIPIIGARGYAPGPDEWVDHGIAATTSTADCIGDLGSGTRTLMQQRCSETPECTVLLNRNSNNRDWRGCRSVQWGVAEARFSSQVLSKRSDNTYLSTATACGSYDFDCYHSPQGKVNAQLKLVEEKAKCVCTQQCSPTDPPTAAPTAAPTAPTAAPSARGDADSASSGGDGGGAGVAIGAVAAVLVLGCIVAAVVILRNRRLADKQSPNLPRVQGVDNPLYQPNMASVNPQFSAMDTAQHAATAIDGPVTFVRSSPNSSLSGKSSRSVGQASA